MILSAMHLKSHPENEPYLIFAIPTDAILAMKSILQRAIFDMSHMKHISIS